MSSSESGIAYERTAFAALRGRFFPRDVEGVEASDFVQEREIERDAEVASVLTARDIFLISSLEI